MVLNSVGVLFNFRHKFYTYFHRGKYILYLIKPIPWLPVRQSGKNGLHITYTYLQ